jgi:hypothetical protein
MLDLSLFRVPTFAGGLIAAFGMSASLFSLLTYIVLYLQDGLGFSAFGTGVRLLLLTLATFVTAGAAGRLTTVIPVRLTISAGVNVRSPLHGCPKSSARRSCGRRGRPADGSVGCRPRRGGWWAGGSRRGQERVGRLGEGDGAVADRGHPRPRACSYARSLPRAPGAVPGLPVVEVVHRGQVPRPACCSPVKSSAETIVIVRLATPLSISEVVCTDAQSRGHGSYADLDMLMGRWRSLPAGRLRHRGLRPRNTGAGRHASRPLAVGSRHAWLRRRGWRLDRQLRSTPRTIRPQKKLSQHADHQHEGRVTRRPIYLYKNNTDSVVNYGSHSYGSYENYMVRRLTQGLLTWWPDAPLWP